MLVFWDCLYRCKKTNEITYCSNNFSIAFVKVCLYNLQHVSKKIWYNWKMRKLYNNMTKDFNEIRSISNYIRSVCSLYCKAHYKRTLTCLRVQHLFEGSIGGLFRPCQYILIFYWHFHSLQMLQDSLKAGPTCILMCNNLLFVCTCLLW